MFEKVRWIICVIFAILMMTSVIGLVVSCAAAFVCLIWGFSANVFLTVVVISGGCISISMFIEFVFRRDN